ncbi:ATP-dependent DNA helicase RecG [Fructobacillus pseudoficulneus]|uniref:ATP-dependent DNA helicase RecG n=1 Tax=Fructobacillus pseudoficulneus TaxID=220714 RepID=A0A3F3GVV0_9LACO|nr:ATP-dependent DNA helicase RecG [Fructobacillus pseudoficulneus]GAP02427.1 ATP-dependent DNA helicase RecG [Fructobacillus pseudoficulneus]SEH36825.1 ATP-dependent DNA helicase RecG [Fructobacillus pseudoficulneus]
MSLALTDSVATLKGVGQKRQDALRELGIFTIEDLLTYYPFRYEDLGARLPSETLDGEKVTFKGIVSTPAIVRRYGKRSQTVLGLLIDRENIRVTFFNQPWVAKNIEVGQEVAVYGTYNAAKAALTAIKLVPASTNVLDPIYPATKSVKAKTIADLIEQAWGLFRGQLPNLVPSTLREKYRLLDKNQQVEWTHFPKDSAEAKAGRRSAAFEEFFIFQMRLQLLKQADQSFGGQPLQYQQAAVDQLIQALPYQLTAAQDRVVGEILADQAAPRHMNRLLQGDVGSGKTVVASIAMYAAVTAGCQAAMMAPTEILAQQHAKSLAKLFDQAGIDLRVELLTSGLKASQRRQILADLEAGEIDIVVGTHALVQDDVFFHHLGLAVIDEQHRFGVKQRSKLREGGMNPDILAMTATPIPRTLSITAYGEMEVSIIDELPAGRKQIITSQLSERQFDQALALVKAELAKGAQAYVVTPLIEESETLDVRNVTEVYQSLQADLPDYTVGLLHGRLPKEDKDTLMQGFKENQIQVLVATTVVEVGVDVPNASIMLILDADRFGLAQLHQLRGRVGRGDRQSYTVLVADPKTEYGKERLNALVETTDGFELAQKDLELRGAGDILGTKQSGMPEFQVGDPVKDLTMLTIAQQEALALVRQSGWDQEEDNQALVAYLSQTMAQFRHFD